jgi:hypothetical protein
MLELVIIVNISVKLFKTRIETKFHEQLKSSILNVKLFERFELVHD